MSCSKIAEPRFKLSSDNIQNVVYNPVDDYLLITTDDGSNFLKIYSPGASLTDLTYSGTVSLVSPVWFWNGEIQYFDTDNSILTIEPTFSCKRFIEYDGLTEFYLDHQNEINLNFTVKNADGSVTNIVFVFKSLMQKKTVFYN